MECPWFFCIGLRYGAGTIAVLGILHPLAYIRAWRQFRSELFLAMYALVGVWSALSALMLLGVLTEAAWLLALWYGYTVLFVVLMVVLLVFVVAGFCVLDMKNTAIIPILGILYYILTLYFACVVNTHRRELLGYRVRRDSGDSETDAAEWLARQGPNTSGGGGGGGGGRRGRCVVPRSPPRGAYVAQTTGGAGQAAGARFPMLRLLLYCDHDFVPRNRRYTDCYYGGWNLPLPQCVPAEEYLEISDLDEADVGTDEDSKKCVARPPPDHGFYLQERGQFAKARYLSLVVACTPMHFLVGRSRVTCRDGVWDRPLPKCQFVDTGVCALQRRAHMRHTCLGGALYPGTYPCEAGLVPPGMVVEPACRDGYYVWRPYNYMTCVDGRWVPAASRNLSCQSKVDIFRHYEIEERRARTATTEVAEDYEVSTDPAPADLSTSSEEADRTEAGDSSSAAATPRIVTVDWSTAEPTTETSGTGPEKSIIRISRSKTGESLGDARSSIWKTWDENEDSMNTDFINLNEIMKSIDKWKSHNENDKWQNDSIKKSIWKTRREVDEPPSANVTDISIWKFRGSAGDGEASSRESTTGTNVWKTQGEGGDSKSDESTEINIWKTRGAAGDAKSVRSTETNTWKTRSVAGDAKSVRSTVMSIWKSDAGKMLSTNSTNKTFIRLSRSEVDAGLIRKLNKINIWKDRSKPATPDARGEPTTPDARSESTRPDTRSESARPDTRSESARPDTRSESARPNNTESTQVISAKSQPTPSATSTRTRTWKSGEEDEMLKLIDEHFDFD